MACLILVCHNHLHLNFYGCKVTKFSRHIVRFNENKGSEENFVRINRSEIVNLNAVDGFEGNCYYVGKNPLYATGVYRQRMEGVFVKAKQQ